MFDVIAAMSERDIQEELRKRGVATTSGMEKADLVHLLITNWDEPQPQHVASGSASRASLPRSVSGPYGGGDNVPLSGMRPSRQQ